MIGRGKDYYASTHLRPFPNMLGNYKYGILEASIENYSQKVIKRLDSSGKTYNRPSSTTGC